MIESKPVMIPPLLLTKFAVPNPGQALVVRPRLFRLLDQSLAPNHRLTLLSAPPGYGKTTLASSWVRQLRQDLPVAWLSLDPEDNDPVRFWSYLVAAIRKQDEGLGKELLPLLQSPAPLIDETFWIVLLNALARREGELVLVLDDFHLIEEPAIQRGLNFLIERLPEGCHVLLLSRADPPLPLALLRGRGQVLEIRQPELSFRDDEAALFLVERLGLPLSTENVRQLNAKSEGWASGLQMAAVSLRGQADPGQFIAAFAGTQRFILEYLIGEVLDRQPPSIRDFLLKTSILEALSVPLCTAVCQVQTGGPTNLPPIPQVLEYLETANLFITPMGEQRNAYCYHPLFADLLRAQLQQTYPEIVRPLHRQASAWLGAHGLPEPAIRHALSAGEYNRAAAMLSTYAETLWSRGEHAALLSLACAIPEEFLLSGGCRAPDLWIYQASAWVSNGNYPEAEKCLEKAGQQMQASGGNSPEDGRLRGRMAGVRALISAFRGDAQETLAYARQAARYQPDENTVWNAYTAYTAGAVLMMDGKLDEARQELQRAVQAGEASGNAYICLLAASQLFKLHWSQGSMGQAEEVIREALAYLQENRLEDTPLAAEIQVHRAFLLMEQGYLEQAEQVIRQSLQASLVGQHYPTIVNIYLILMSCQTARRDWPSAEETYRQAEEILQQHEVPQWSECGLAGSIACIWARQGQLARTEQFLLGRGVTPQGQVAYPHQAEYVALAYVLLRQRRLQLAGGVLERLVGYVRTTQQWAGLVPILYLQAEWFQLQGQTGRALQILQEALDLAERYGQIQAFFLLDDALIPLLKKVAAHRGASEAFHRLIAWASARAEAAPEREAAAASADLVENLSARELEVLKLLGEGFANKEIARRLHLALQTVKFHTSNIYGKLGVENRTQAVRKAQSLGLLSTDHPG